MHVCFVLPAIEHYSPASGGAIATVSMSYAKCLIASGHSVTVVGPGFDGERYDLGTFIQVPAPHRNEIAAPARAAYKVMHRLRSWDQAYYPPYLAGVKRALRRARPQSVIFHNDLVTPKYARAACPEGRFFIHVHNELRTRQRDLCATNAAVTGYLAVSGHIREWMCREHSIPASKVHLLPNGVDTEKFCPRTDFVEPRAPLRVLFVGRIDPIKGPDIVADAVKRLRAAGVSLDLTVCGSVWFYNRPGDEENAYLLSLKQKIRDAGGTYVGHTPRSDIPALIRSHDVVCVLSRWNDPYPLVVLEAMASGCAVVASARGGIPEAAGGAAELVDPDDPDAVVTALRRLATDGRALQAAKRAALARAAGAAWRLRTATLEALLI